MSSHTHTLSPARPPCPAFPFHLERVRERHVQTGLGREEARVRVETNDLPNAVLVNERCPWGEVDLVIDSV